MTDLILLRNSERSTWRRCRQKWEWSYAYLLEPKQRGKALTFGTMVHQALAEFYKPGKRRGPHPAHTFLEVYDAQPEDFVQYDEAGDKIDARDLGWNMLNGYVDTYGKDDHLQVLKPEMGFQIDVYDENGDYLCTLVGTIDAVARNLRTGRTVLLEHKTAKYIEDVRINSGYGEQGLTYWWAACLWLRHLGFLKEGELVDSVLFNFLRKAMPDLRPRNAQGHYLNQPTKDQLTAALAARDVYLRGKPDKAALEQACVDLGLDPAMFGEPSKLQPPPLFQRQELIFGPGELHTFERRLRKEAREIIACREMDGEVEVYKNPTRDCSWDCPFVNACEIHEMGGDYEGVLEFDFKEWAPYEEHELALERD